MNKNIIIAISVFIFVALPLAFWLVLRSPSEQPADRKNAGLSAKEPVAVLPGLSVLNRDNPQIKLGSDDIVLDFNEGNVKLSQADATKYQFLKEGETLGVDGRSAKYLVTLLRCKRMDKIEGGVSVPYVIDCTVGVKKDESGL